MIALIKKHEAFEKSSTAQDERFMALEKLTNFELKEMQQRGKPEGRRRRKSFYFNFQSARWTRNGAGVLAKHHQRAAPPERKQCFRPAQAGSRRVEPRRARMKVSLAHAFVRIFCVCCAHRILS